MKYWFKLGVVAFLIAGSGAVFPNQIEGIRWTYDGGGELHMTRFLDGEFSGCSTRVGEWEVIGGYEIDGEFLILRTGEKEQRKKMTVTGEGNEKVLVFGNAKMVVAKTDACMEKKVSGSAPVPVTSGLILPEQIEGVRWTADGRDERQMVRFVDGQFSGCRARIGEWKTIGTYDLDGNAMILRKQGKEQRMELSMTGEGDEMIFILGEQKMVLAKTDACTDKKGGYGSRMWCKSMKAKPEAEWTPKDSMTFMDSCKASDLIGK